MKKEILRIAEKQKISKVGICSAAAYLERMPPDAAKPAFLKSGAEMTKDINSVIVCAFSYYSGAEKGNISRYAQGKDYHITAKQKMEEICAFIRKNGYSAEAFADTGSLNERFLGRLSGISFTGRNKMAINRDLGSWFFIGYILTNCSLEADEECRDSCLGCEACVKACPLGALNEEAFDEEKCLSYITQKKGELSESEAELIRKCNTVWGCDICQEVCPHNRDLTVTEIDEFKENLIINLNLDENISNREFKKMYGDRAFSWRGKGVLIRNQKILYNKKKNEK